MPFQITEKMSLPTIMVKTRANAMDDNLSSDSSGLSRTSSLHSSQKRILQTRFVWKNTWDYIITALAFTTSPRSMWSFVDVHCSLNDCPNIYQYSIIYIFVGMPLVYMFVILGQYAQMGILHLKYMCPIGHGSVYVCLILIILYIILNTILMADYLMYFLTTFQENVQWMVCPKEIANQCWSGTEGCRKNCISETVHLSAYWYWNNTYMDTLTIQNNKKIEINLPSLPRMVAIAFSVAFVWFIVALAPLAFKRKLILWLFYLSMCFAIGLMFSIGGLSGTGRGLDYMFNMHDPHVFYNIAAWSHAIAVVIRNLCMGKACQMIFGSYMSSMTFSGIRTSMHVLSNLMVHIILGMLTHMALGAITYKANIEFKDYLLILYNFKYVDYELIIVPQCIGFQYAPQFWNLIYFGMNFCLLLSNQMMLHGVFVKCIGDTFESFLRYGKYIYSAISLFTVLISTLLISKGIFLFYNELRKTMVMYIELIITVAMSIVTLWIYGIKRLSDDLHFITGQQPTKFWKIFWIINPVILIAAILTVNLYTDIKRNTLRIIELIFYFVFTSPIPILGSLEIFKYLKQKNLVGLLQPEEIWGPPDAEERIMRTLFNPRKEIKSRRRAERCQHKCLLGSKVLKRIVHEETKVRNERNSFNDDKVIQPNIEYP